MPDAPVYKRTLSKGSCVQQSACWMPLCTAGARAGCGPVGCVRACCRVLCHAFLINTGVTFPSPVWSPASPLPSHLVTCLTFLPIWTPDPLPPVFDHLTSTLPTWPPPSPSFPSGQLILSHSLLVTRSSPTPYWSPDSLPTWSLCPPRGGLPVFLPPSLVRSHPCHVATLRLSCLATAVLTPTWPTDAPYARDICPSTLCYLLDPSPVTCS